ncbi:RNA polymerase sigma-70 factor [Xanthocytophaga flava]|uniref:RNA polymerase sigma-70 factor n=1 Tax=Xanthocytophaga flava TaxID=3048013 RepID=UPI0028D4EFA1|nr:RNA polymerase sigma-70 factor [Xanthocytophaga flavus]MDJ1470295.1 RNA polymerase sigma-70 factor [Xanthocytophaga flavus]
MDAPFPEDDQLLALLKASDRHVFNLIYKKYWKKFYRIALYHVKSSEVAKDIIQDLFTSLWVRREDLTITKGLDGYLSSALKYQILNYIRNQSLHQSHHTLILKQSSALSHSTEEQIHFQQVTDAVQDQIQKLPERSREVFELSRNEGRSLKEIAQLLQISPKTVEVHMSKALRLLRIGLREFLYVFVFISIGGF